MEMDLFWGIPNQYFISPIAILFSATVAILVARFNVNSQRKLARTRATSDIIVKIETDQDFIAAETIFKQLKKNNFSTLKVESYTPKSVTKNGVEEKLDEEVHVLTFLNMYESIFLGITMDVYDELLMFRYKRGAILQNWKDAEELIKYWREIDNNERLYEMIELFVTTWQQNNFVTRWRPFPEYYLKSPKSLIVKQDNWI